MPFPTSVVIPTHNRPDGVAETLRHLLEAGSSSQFEVVVVDDGSNPPLSLDLTAGVRIVRTPGIERSRARNLGAATATGSLVIFLDDDNTVSPDFVGAHERAAKEFGNVIGVGGISAQAEMARSPFGRFRWLIEGPSQIHPRGFVAQKNFCTAANMSMRRETFLSLGGFDPAIVSSEDQDLALRFSDRGGKLVFVPEATVLHRDSNSDLASYCRRHEWGARAMAPFIRRYPDWADNKPRVRFERGFGGAHTVGEQSAFLVRLALSQPALVRILLRSAAACERAGCGDRLLFPVYHVLLGLHLFRGFREGLSQVKAAPALPAKIEAA